MVKKIKVTPTEKDVTKRQAIKEIGNALNAFTDFTYYIHVREDGKKEIHIVEQ